MLYRDIAPVSGVAWKEIDERASEVLKTYLAARKVVNVVGPKGLDFNAISKGRLTDVNEVDGIYYGHYQILPLMETRVEFELNRWELDNVDRGAKDIDYKPLEKAMVKLALFEDKVIFDTLDSVMTHKTLKFGDDTKTMMEAISQGVLALKKAFVNPPYTLVVSPKAYQKIYSESDGYPLSKRIEKLIEGKIVINHAIEGIYLLPYDHENLQLTIGQDFSIGYQNHNNESVRFYVRESFVFRVLDDEIFIKYDL